MHVRLGWLIVGAVLGASGCKSEAEKAAEKKAALELECNKLKAAANAAWKKVNVEVAPAYEALKAKRAAVPNDKNAKAKVVFAALNREECAGLIGVFEQNIEPKRKDAWAKCNAEANAMNEELRAFDELARKLEAESNVASGALGATSTAARDALEPKAVRAKESAERAAEKAKALGPPSLAMAVAASSAAHDVCVQVAP